MTDTPSAVVPAQPDALPPGQLRWRFAQVEFDESQLRLRVRNAEREIEPRPLQALMFFLRHAGEVVTKDELLENLWPGRIVTEASLTVCVAKLRQALEDEDQSIIRTVHGYGYRFAVPVTVETVAAVAPALETLRLAEGAVPPLRPNWRLLRRLGFGGFGEAWLCEQAKTHEQRVFKFSADGAQLSALKREVTLFRLLNDELGQRPDLLQLRDWNFEAPPFFIEMEYCAEGSLAQWAASRGGIRAVPLSQRLDLFVQIAECVAAAHSLGVLHKDLKPANILIAIDATGMPKAKLSDWGSGWLLDAERLHKAGITRLGFTQSVASSDSGTSLYQAPEVRRGQPASVQGDVYALGVLLYQLVVGDLDRALAPGWEQDITDELLREDILRAADGDCQRRLGDAAELAQRIRNLEARRVERERQRAEAEESRHARELVQRMRQRRQWAWAVAVTFLIGFAVSTLLYLDAQRHARKAEAVSRFLTKDLLSSANPGTAGGKDVKVSAILGTAEASLNSRFASDPDTLLSLQTVLGGAYASLDIRDRSESLLKPALASAIERHGHDSAEAQAAREALLDLYVGQRDNEAINRIGAEALAIERDIGKADSEFALQIEQNLVAVQCWTEGYAACQPGYVALIEHAERVLGRDHEMPASFSVGYSSVLTGLGRKDEALSLAQDGVQRMSKALGPEHPTVLTRRVHIAYQLMNFGRADEAIRMLEELGPRIAKIYDASSSQAFMARRMVALAYSKAGRAADALPIFDACYAQRVRDYGETNIEVRLVRRQRAVVLDQLGRRSEALSEIAALQTLHRQDKNKNKEEKAELDRLSAEFSKK